MPKTKGLWITTPVDRYPLFNVYSWSMFISTYTFFFLDPVFAACSVWFSWLCLAARYYRHFTTDLCDNWDFWCPSAEGQIPIQCMYSLPLKAKKLALRSEKEIYREFHLYKVDLTANANFIFFIIIIDIFVNGWNNLYCHISFKFFSCVLGKTIVISSWISSSLE